MKYGEAKEQIKALSSKYSVRLDRFGGKFNVDYKGSEVAYVSTIHRYSVVVLFEIYFKTLPFSNKLYMIMAELAMTPIYQRVEDKKYYIHVLEGNKGYLNIDDGKVRFDNKNEEHGFKTKFIDKEIDELKQRVDIPLDWNKVKLEEVE